MEHFAFPGNIDLICLFIVCEKFTIGESRTIPMQMTHKQNKWLQILAQEDFPPKLLWSENADCKFSVNNEGEDVNKKPRSRRNIA